MREKGILIDQKDGMICHFHLLTKLINWLIIFCSYPSRAPAAADLPESGHWRQPFEAATAILTEVEGLPSLSLLRVINFMIINFLPCFHFGNDQMNNVASAKRANRGRQACCGRVWFAVAAKWKSALSTHDMATVLDFNCGSLLKANGAKLCISITDLQEVKFPST